MSNSWPFPFLDLRRVEGDSASTAVRRSVSCDFEGRPRPVHRSPSKKTKRSASYGCLRPSTSTTMRFRPKQQRNLQLPSFESLGIAIPSPTQEQSSRDPPSLVTDLSSTSPYPASMPITPPEYDDQVRWDSPFALSEPAPSQTLQRSKNNSSDPTRHSTPDLTPTNAGEMANTTGLCSPEDEDEDEDLWLQNAYTAAVASLEISTRPGEAVQLVSQSLPCPPPNCSATANPPSAFVPIVQAIQSRLQPGQSPYINIIHAVPPKFSLSSLPTSPPSTPNLLFPGDDYFNLTVFSSATPVNSYPETDLASSPTTAPYAPSLIVPPFSVHVSVLERYLPPPTAQEYLDLFSPRAPSVLVNRLVELSPNDGTMVFIYPTKQGAQTFEQNYLSPILDPLLRHLVVVNGLSADVGMALGHMAAVPHMDDFETMRCRIAQLCRDLNGREKSSPRPTNSNFDVVYAEKGGINVDRDLWTEWHIHQDTPRMRSIIGNYWRNRYRFTTNDSPVTGSRHPPDDGSAGALRELLEGIRRRSKSEPKDPQKKLELGVFVIKRSQS